MRIKIVLKACDKLTLPRSYQSIVRDFLLTAASVSKDFQKLSFSNLKGDFISNADKKLEFNNTINLYVSSSDESFIKALYEGLVTDLVINNQNVLLEEKQINTFTVKFDSYSLKTISAATVYEVINGKAKYYNPNDEKFYEIINKNIRSLLKNNDADNIAFTNVEKIKKVVTTFNSTIIEAYLFECRIIGPKDSIAILYNNGIGNRTFQGFGMCMLGK